MKVNIKNVGGEITKDNETYTLQDNNFLNNLTLSSTFLKPNQSTRGHSHDDLEEVYFITKGIGVMVLGDTSMPVETGDVILIPAGKFHRVINDTDEMLEFVCVFQKYDRSSDTAKYKLDEDVSGPNGRYGVWEKW